MDQSRGPDSESGIHRVYVAHLTFEPYVKQATAFSYKEKK